MALFHVDCVFRVSREGFPDSYAQMAPATHINLHQQVKRQLHWLWLMTRPGHRCFTDPDYNLHDKFISVEFALDLKGLWANAIPIYHYNLQCMIYSKVSMEKMQGMLTSWSLWFFSNSLWLNCTSFSCFFCSLAEGLEEPVKQKDISDGVYAYEYYPHTPGKYTVTITWAGQHIPKRWASPEPITSLKLMQLQIRATSHTRSLRSEKSDRMLCSWRPIVLKRISSCFYPN